MEKGKVRKGILISVWIVQLVSEGLALYYIGKLNMLPGKYSAAAYLIFLILAAATGIPLLRSAKTIREGRRRAGFIIAAAAALLISFMCFYIVHLTSKLSNTMGKVTDGQTNGIVSEVAVYVRKEDPAQELSDMGKYVFAVIKDDPYISQAVESIETMLGSSIAKEPFDTITDMIDALYSGKTQAVILKKAYVDVLEDIEGYEDFLEHAREVYSISVTRKPADDEKNTAESDTAGKKNRNETLEKGPVSVTSDPFLLYLSGLDTRKQKLATSRSDVNILAAVNPVTRQVLLVNTPRDYYVPNPAGDGALDKLTHCGIYGIECSVNALSELYDEEIDYYAQINFTGFETLIDAIGGVTVYSDKAFVIGKKYPIQVGNNLLDGQAALSFARERYSLAGGDNDRGKNQMKVIKAVIQKMSSGALLTSYSDILASLEGMFVTNMSADDISKLVKMQLAEMPEWDVLSYAVTGTGARKVTYSMPGMSLYVMEPNEDTVEHATELIDKLFAGEILTEKDVSGN